MKHWEITIPFYYILRYWNTSSKVRHLKSSQKATNWILDLGNIKRVWNKGIESKITTKILEKYLKYWEQGHSFYDIERCQTKNYQIGPGNWKTLKINEINQRNSTRVYELELLSL